jgi:hypothetical protein
MLTIAVCDGLGKAAWLVVSISTQRHREHREKKTTRALQGGIHEGICGRSVVFSVFSVSLC